MNLIDQMRTFVRVIDAGSLSAAARRTRMSAAAVSRQVSALEADLGATLIVRSTRHLQITDAGQRWYQHCVRMLRELEDARAEVSAAGAPVGKVTISAPATLGLWHVVPRLEALSRRYPRLEIELRLEDAVIDLVSEGVDLAVRAGLTLPDSTSLIATPLIEFDRIAVAAPAYLKRRGTPRHPRELARHDCIGQLAPSVRWRFRRGDELVELTPWARLRCGTPFALRDWAVAGAGVALVPAWSIEGYRGQLRRLFADWTIARIKVWALQRVELRGLPRIAAVVDALRA